jgi:O-antigen ligase
MSPRHHRRRKTVARPWAERLIEAGVLALLVFTPLAYGTVELWSEAIAELLILGLGVIWLLAMLPHWELRFELPAGWQPAGLFLALIVLQALPLPNVIVGLISPAAASLTQEAWAFTGGSSSTMALSLQPDATWRLTLKFLALGLFFLVVYNTYRSRAQARRAVWVMIGMGTLLALFGIVQRMTWNGRFYWVGPEAPGPSAFGPFVNRTHFAGLIVVIVPVALALLLADRRHPTRHRQRHSHDWQARLRSWNSQEAGPASLIPWLIFLMGGAALVGGSRGGLLALLAVLVLMIGLGARGAAGRGRGWRIALVSLLVVLSGLWIGSDIIYGTVERLAEELGQPEESLRLHVWADALHLWWQFPALGSGLATFGVAFPMVRTLAAPVTFTHAESDWMQLLTDTGAVGLLLILLSLGMVVLTLRHRYRQASSQWSRSFALAGLVALLGAAVQSVANFNLPVMSNFIYLALTVALALRADDMTEPHGHTP